jgi:hypothetical protein
LAGLSANISIFVWPRRRRRICRHYLCVAVSVATPHCPRLGRRLSGVAQTCCLLTTFAKANSPFGATDTWRAWEANRRLAVCEAKNVKGRTNSDGVRKSSESLVSEGSGLGCSADMLSAVPHTCSLPDLRAEKIGQRQPRRSSSEYSHAACITFFREMLRYVPCGNPMALVHQPTFSNR